LPSFSHSLKERTLDVWERGYRHPFVQEAGAGTLDPAKFRWYMIQDWHYLYEYAKVFALACVKAPDHDLVGRFVESQHLTLIEADGHVQRLAQAGISGEEIRSSRPALYNRMYTANMLAVGQTGDLAELLAAVFPCAWTYSDYAKRLREQYRDTYEDNPYRDWIEGYASKEFEESFGWFFDALDTFAGQRDEAGRQRIVEVFRTSVEFEWMFWEMSYHMQETGGFGPQKTEAGN